MDDTAETAPSGPVVEPVETTSPDPNLNRAATAADQRHAVVSTSSTTGCGLNEVAGVVLTGGSSRRMGTDKALIEVGGVAMAARAAAALAGAGCTPVWCQGGDVDRLAALGLAARPDRRPGDGPLPAIADALEGLEGGHAGLIAVACDLPDLTADVLGSLIDVATPDAPAALALDGEPQLVSWWPFGLAGPLAALIDSGVRAHRAALAALGARLVAVPAGSVRNVNTPSDL